LSTSFPTAGFPTRCRFAQESFYGDLSVYSSLLNFQGHQQPFCLNDGSTNFGLASSSPPSALSCDIYFQDSALYAAGTVGRDPYNPSVTVNRPPAVRCTTTVTIEMSATPVSWVYRWDPVVTFTAEVVPPTFRQ
jgi:hypothetical protein